MPCNANKAPPNSAPTFSQAIHAILFAEGQQRYAMTSKQFWPSTCTNAQQFRLRPQCNGQFRAICANVDMCGGWERRKRSDRNRTWWKRFRDSTAWIWCGSHIPGSCILRPSTKYLRMMWYPIYGTCKIEHAAEEMLTIKTKINRTIFVSAYWT